MPMGLTKNEYMELMYPDGVDGKRATCVKVVEGQLCGERGTLYRLKSEIGFHTKASEQLCNVLCHLHHCEYGSKTCTKEPEAKEDMCGLQSRVLLRVVSKQQVVTSSRMAATARESWPASRVDAVSKHKTM